MKLVDIEEIWEYNKDVIDSIISPFRLSAEDVFNQCKAGQAFCFVVDEGFFIVRPLIGADGKIVLEALIAYGNGENLMNKYTPSLVELAKDIGAVRVEFGTMHDKVGEKSLEAGFKKRETIYELEIDNG